MRIHVGARKCQGRGNDSGRLGNEHFHRDGDGRVAARRDTVTAGGRGTVAKMPRGCPAEAIWLAGDV